MNNDAMAQRIRTLAGEYRSAMADYDASRAAVAAGELIPLLEEIGLTDPSRVLVVDGRSYWVDSGEAGARRIVMETTP